jgi:hypothetical protein
VRQGGLLATAINLQSFGSEDRYAPSLIQTQWKTVPRATSSIESISHTLMSTCGNRSLSSEPALTASFIASMYRISLTIDLEDKVLMRETAIGRRKLQPAQ